MTTRAEWVRRRWRSVTWETRCISLVALLFVLIRLAVASTSSFGTYQGWNEGWYAHIARGFSTHPLVPVYVGDPVYNVTPLFGYLVAAAFALFGESTLAARAPSVLAAGVTVVATYSLGRELYPRRTAALGAAVLAVLPLFTLYGGRAQTDLLLLGLVTLSLVGLARGYRRDEQLTLVLGGVLWSLAVAAKQPAILLPAVVLGWLVTTRGLDAVMSRDTAYAVLGGAVGLLPLVGWYAAGFWGAPGAVAADLGHELLGRTPPFSNVPLLVAVGFGLGMTPPVLALAAVEFGASLRDGFAADRALLVWWAAIFGAFVFYRTPRGHQYYAVVLLPAVALLAAGGLERLGGHWPSLAPKQPLRYALVALVLLSGVVGTAVFFELSGEFSIAEAGGETVTREAGSVVSTLDAPGATFVVASDVNPQLRWYTRGEVPPDRLVPRDPRSLTTADLRSIQRDADGPVYLVSPEPAWAPVPASATLVHETRPYRLTLTDPASGLVEPGTKAAFYLQDRRLRIYRFGPADGEA